MKWAESAIHDLKSYNSYIRSLDNLKERLIMLEKRFESARTASISSAPMHGGGNRYEDAMIDIIVEKENLKLSIDIENRKVKLIERGLSALTEEGKYILSTFYISRPKNHIDVICEKLNMEKTTVYRVKDAALRQFTLEEYGIDI
ncbi:hypothetical protein SDC9_154021 [bioreactor metagenome]|uniref:DUF1492 domain-containing protein n=1 Tax=bioreactor metagenome TaxID=1076179 RepID=A0A645F2F3_9ZZZZ